MLGLILVSLAVAGASFYYFREITWKEFLLQMGGTCVLLVAAFNLAKCSMLMDTEYLSGRITKKTKGTEKCCHCRMECVSFDAKGNCTARVERCTHSHDYWWALRTTVGTITVEDCSGSSSTPRIWKNAKVGEPATKENSYKNYLFADKESLIRHDAINQYDKQVPKFPGVHGLYKRRHVISSGPKIPKEWQEAVIEWNADNGGKYQIDLILLLTSVKDPTYAQAVESKWLYGPKNSLTIVLGMEEGRVAWAQAVTFSKVEELKIRVRDELPGAENVPEKIFELVGAHFKRTPMSKYEYLEKSMTLSTGWTIALYIFALLLSIGISIVMHRKDVFGDE